MKRMTYCEMRIVIEIRSGGDYPVNETRLYKRDNARAAEPGRSKSAGQTHSNRHVSSQHFLRK